MNSKSFLPSTQREYRGQDKQLQAPRQAPISHTNHLSLTPPLNPFPGQKPLPKPLPKPRFSTHLQQLGRRDEALQRLRQAGNDDANLRHLGHRPHYVGDDLMVNVPRQEAAHRRGEGAIQVPKQVVAGADGPPQAHEADIDHLQAKGNICRVLGNGRPQASVLELKAMNCLGKRAGDVSEEVVVGVDSPQGAHGTDIDKLHKWKNTNRILLHFSV